jgi:hypothetical protein
MDMRLDALSAVRNSRSVRHSSPKSKVIDRGDLIGRQKNLQTPGSFGLSRRHRRPL